MTAIAFDGKTLAADTMYDQGGHKGFCSKLEVLNHPIIGKMMVAFCGHTRGITIMSRQLEIDKVEKVDDYDVQSVYAIGIDSAKNVYSIYGDGYCVLEHPKNKVMACGSAWEFLYGAMFAGACAERAIGLALEHRTDAGNVCETLVWAEVFKDYEHERFNDDIPH